jgi:hypothetical protein
MNIIFIIIIIVLAASVAIASTFTEFGSFGIAQAQGNNITSSLTPEQKAAICDPSDVHVNSTESRICRIPKTPSSNTTSS